MSHPGERELRSFLERSTGFEIPEDRWRFLAPKFLDRLDGRGFGDVPEYLHYLETDPMGRTELEEIFCVLTVRKTSFFRNPASFDALGKEVIPRIVRKNPRLPLAIWSAGCSTGEEPYSIAMVAKQVLGASKINYYILASDIVREALAKARLGSYPERELAGVPPDYRHYLQTQGGRVQVREDVRDTVEFTEHNLVHDRMPRSATGRWDIIFCRNVFIYFSQELAYQVLRRFTQVLAPGGVLFLGHAEVFTAMEDDYEVVFWGDTFYYRKRQDPRIAPVRAAAPPTTRPRPKPPAPKIEEGRARAETRRAPRPSTSFASAATRRFRRPDVKRAANRPKPPPDPNDSTAFKVGIHRGQTPTRAFRRLDEPPSTQPIDEPEILPTELLVQADRRVFADDLEGAARTLRAAINRAPRWAEPRIRLAQIYIRQRNAYHAHQELQTAIEVEPLEPKAHYLIGKLRADEQDHAKAEVSFRRALYLEPEYVEARCALARTYRALKRKDRASRELRATIRTIRGLDSTRLQKLGDGSSRDALIDRCQREILEMGGSLADSGIWPAVRPPDPKDSK